MRALIAWLPCLIIASAEARIGETSIQFADRYGRPVDSQLTKITDSQFPLIEGAVHHTYEYKGWKIRAAFLQLDRPAVRVDYQKLSASGVSPVIQEYELQAIANANTPEGMSWRPTAYDNPNSPSKGFSKLAEGMFASATGQKMWQRSDGAVLWLQSNLVVRLELPAARQYEQQLKAAKEQKARAAVPQF
ncbi:MAG: hypothetical protein H0X73_11645 [Chthoniobacterales bacterium]|nr:hypothetical protein [Chthoniobacterales bacterium]